MQTLKNINQQLTIKGAIPEDHLKEEAKKEILKKEKLKKEKMVNREDLIYETNRYIISSNLRQ